MELLLFMDFGNTLRTPPVVVLEFFRQLWLNPED
jgi:hypothetical protein